MAIGEINCDSFILNCYLKFCYLAIVAQKTLWSINLVIAH